MKASSLFQRAGTSFLNGCFLGIDLGGTKIRLAIADNAGKILQERALPTPNVSIQNLLEQIESTTQDLLNESNVHQHELISVGIGTPGVAGDDGFLSLSPNVNGLDSIALVDELSKFFRCPIFADNDANLAALGELVAGSGVGLRSLVTISVGTGIGAGIILNGEIYRGHRGFAGEVAYLPDERSENAEETKIYGATEMLSGTVGLLAYANQKFPDRFPNVQAIFESASDGNEDAFSLMIHEAKLIARVVVALQSALDPELFVLAGGIGSHPLLSPEVSRQIARWLPYPIVPVPSALGNRAGIIGAIELALRGDGLLSITSQKRDLAQISKPRTQMTTEISEIPAVFEHLINEQDVIGTAAETLRTKNFHSAIILARGTSANAGLFLRQLIECEIGLPVSMASAATISIYRRHLRLDGVLLIGLSQSGESPDLISFAESAMRSGAFFLALTNTANSPMAQMADIHLGLGAKTEKAVAATKSYAAELLLSKLLVDRWVGNDAVPSLLISEARRLVGESEGNAELVSGFVGGVDITVLGRGYSYANAKETALKIQETSRIPVQAYSGAEFLHGPIATLHLESRVIVVAPFGSLPSGYLQAIDRVRAITPRISWIGKAEFGKPNEIRLGGSEVQDEIWSTVADSIVLQSFANALSLANGLNPDAPKGLSKITKTR